VCVCVRACVRACVRVCAIIIIIMNENVCSAVYNVSSSGALDDVCLLSVCMQIDFANRFQRIEVANPMMFCKSIFLMLCRIESV